jgi:hypothetical protein
MIFINRKLYENKWQNVKINYMLAISGEPLFVVCV